MFISAFDSTIETFNNKQILWAGEWAQKTRILFHKTCAQQGIIPEQEVSALKEFISRVVIPVMKEKNVSYVLIN